MEEEKEQGRGVWRLDCGAMVGWFARLAGLLGCKWQVGRRTLIVVAVS